MNQSSGDADWQKAMQKGELPTSVGNDPEPSEGLCPWCHFPLPAGAEKCLNCRWTQRGASAKTAALIYGAFILLMIVLFGIAVWYIHSKFEQS